MSLGTCELGFFTFKMRSVTSAMLNLGRERLVFGADTVEIVGEILSHLIIRETKKHLVNVPLLAFASVQDRLDAMIEPTAHLVVEKFVLKVLGVSSPPPLYGRHCLPLKTLPSDIPAASSKYGPPPCDPASDFLVHPRRLGVFSLSCFVRERLLHSFPK